MSSDAKQTFLIDGRNVSEAEARALFRDGKVTPAELDLRQQQALAFVQTFVAPGRFLDVGCYGGTFLQAVRSACPGLEVAGVDSIPDHIRLAQMLYPDWREEFQCRSAYALGYADGSFAGVSLLEVIEHLDRPVDAVRELNRVLRSGGFLILSTPNGASWDNVLSTWVVGYRNVLARRRGERPRFRSRVYFANVAWNRHIMEFVPACLHTLLEQNGFEVVDHRFIPGRGWRGVRDRLLPGLGPEQIFVARKVGEATAALV